MVDYTVPVEDSDYTISENARLALTEEVMIQWLLTMDGVLNEEEMANCYEIGPVLCRLYAGCLMRVAAQVKMVNRNRPLSSGVLTPLSLEVGDPGQNPSTIQLITAAAVTTALNWNVRRQCSLATTNAKQLCDRTRLIHMILKGLYKKLGRGKAEQKTVAGDGKWVLCHTYVVDPNITHVKIEYEKEKGFNMSEAMYSDARELLRLQEVFCIVEAGRKYDDTVIKAVTRVYAACVFRAAARVVCMKKGESLGNAAPRPVSVLVGDTGETPGPVQVNVSRAVVRATQWGPVGWNEIVKKNPENAVRITQLVHKLVRAIFISN